MKRYCKICGELENDHHTPDWIEVPDGCVCDPMTWEDNIPAPCEKYAGNGVQNCLKCEHDKACHKGAQ